MQSEIPGCAIVGFEENQEIAVEYDSAGRAVALKPVPGSNRAFIDLRLPVGTVIRAEIAPSDFESIERAWA